MTQVKLTRVWIGKQDTKYGEKDKVSIKCEQLKEEWLSTLKVTESMKNWKEGDVVEINVTKKKSADGTKTFYNFEEGLSFNLPQKEAEQMSASKDVEDDIFIF